MTFKFHKGVYARYSVEMGNAYTTLWQTYSVQYVQKFVARDFRRCGKNNY